MLELIIFWISALIFILAGAYFMQCAVKRLIAKHYFLFGLNIMLTVYETAFLVKAIFKC